MNLNPCACAHHTYSLSAISSPLRPTAARRERIYPFPTAIDLSSGKTDTYCNKVAPTARIYLHLICRKRHLPLKLRKGKTKGGAEQKLNTVLTYGEAATVSSAPSTPGNRKALLGLTYGEAALVSSVLPNRATRDICIRRCPNAPLKRKNRDGGYRSGFLNAYYQSCFWALILTPGPMVEAVTQDLMYWPFAAAGFALMIAPMRAA